MNKERNSKGSLEVICGSMFSGKSEELIRRLKRAELARLSVITFKPSIDHRNGTHHVSSHNGNKVCAIPVEDPTLIIGAVQTSTDVVGIDEVQFFPFNIINVVCALVDQGKRVIVAGLDLDFRGVPFGSMPTFMAIADSVTKLKAICMECGSEAHFTQRLVNGMPARCDDPIIMVGAQEHYQARCRRCHIIDQKPSF